ncbi:MAG TPA: DUF4232 domain-containing protein [Jatrophihabitans sp.]|jgi:hypothetical protein
MRTYLAGSLAAVLAALGLAVTAAPADAAPVPQCKGALLRITHGMPDAGMGHGFLVLRFRNISQRTCALRGYPGLDALRRNGTVLAHAKRTLHGQTGARRVSTIVLQPNRVASASVEWSNFNTTTAGSCANSHSIAVTAPNTFRTVHFRVSVTRCDLQIHPVVKGRSGRNLPRAVTAARP